MADSYATVQDMRDRGVTPGAADDPAVERVLDRAKVTIDAYCGRGFLLREETYFVDGTGKQAIFLDDRPVVSITELKVDDTVVPPEDLRLYGEAGYIRLVNGLSVFAACTGVFPRGVQNVSVHGFFGFQVPPPEVKEACILLALQCLKLAAAETDILEAPANTTQKAVGIKRVKIDDLSVEYQYPRETSVSVSRKKTTGLVEADRLLWRHRRDLEAIAV